MLRSAGGSSVMSRPSRRSCPPLGSSSPAMIFISVLLPQPDGPPSTRNSPSARPIERACRILPPPQLFWTLIRSSDAICPPLDGPGHQAADEILAGPQVDDERRDGGDE